MNQTIMLKGKLVGLRLKKTTKSRQANSSIGYFELNGKTIVPYNLKHYLRTTNSSVNLIDRIINIKQSQKTSNTPCNSLGCKLSVETFSSEHEIFEFPWLKSTLSSTVQMNNQSLKGSVNELVISPHEVKKKKFEQNT